jgi:hypothetical protein
MTQLSTAAVACRKFVLVIGHNLVSFFISYRAWGSCGL